MAAETLRNTLVIEIRGKPRLAGDVASAAFSSEVIGGRLVGMATCAIVQFGVVDPYHEEALKNQIRTFYQKDDPYKLEEIASVKLDGSIEDVPDGHWMESFGQFTHSHTCQAALSIQHRLARVAWRVPSGLWLLFSCPF